MKNTPVTGLLLIAAIGFHMVLAGCMSGVTRDPGAKPIAATKITPLNPLAQVTVELTPAVVDKLKDNLSFDRRELRASVELALSNRRLFDETRKAPAPSLHITVTRVRMRSTLNAMMLGVMAGKDVIEGHVIVNDESGAVVDEFNVQATHGLVENQDAMIMGRMYEEFGTQVVQALTGQNQ